ncbi:hypothetical protein BJY04DRAFT_203116 [Aspergillus karnatakaensis]|uniref:uncharacterized protein n=1 Tax=Aspergillus karnatakaensis TaxID=1810916 RepID=UPI003CCD5BFD
MPPFRNFLGRRPVTPNSGGGAETLPDTRLSEDNRSTPLSIRKSHETEPPEYKLSVVDCNGEYLPPSPPEKESFWSRKYPGMSRSSSNHRNLVDENEPFSISRESFDSYRRSFDISARSPVTYADAMPSRTSLDSRFSRMSSTSVQRLNERPVEEDQFEDVGLDDEEAKPKKKGIFSRFGDFSSDGQSGGSTSKPTSHLGFHLPGRKKPQAPPSSEMGAMKSPAPPEVSEVREA